MGCYTDAGFWTPHGCCLDGRDDPLPLRAETRAFLVVPALHHPCHRRAGEREAAGRQYRRHVCWPWSGTPDSDGDLPASLLKHT